MEIRILMVNVPHPSIGSRAFPGAVPPLGLLAIGGPLIDAGTRSPCWTATRFLPLGEVSGRCVAHGRRRSLGHSGRPGASDRRGTDARGSGGRAAGVDRLRRRLSDLSLARDPRAEPQIDVIVRGEGEETARRLIAALREGSPLSAIDGIAFREGGRSRRAGRADDRDLDAYGRLGADRLHALRLLGRGAPSSCSFRAAARTCAIIAANADSGRAGGIATRERSRPRWRASPAPRCQRVRPRRREPDQLECAWLIGFMACPTLHVGPGSLDPVRGTS